MRLYATYLAILTVNFNLGILIRYIWIECEGIQYISLISPLYSLHIYEKIVIYNSIPRVERGTLLIQVWFLSFHHSVYFYFLNLARYYPYTLLVSDVATLIATLGRTSTVLGRFYYGISRHSIQLYRRPLLYPVELWAHTPLSNYW